MASGDRACEGLEGSFSAKALDVMVLKTANSVKGDGNEGGDENGTNDGGNESSRTTSSSSRRVSFPLHDNGLVTGYLEPANPWANGEISRKYTDVFECYLLLLFSILGQVKTVTTAAASCPPFQPCRLFCWHFN